MIYDYYCEVCAGRLKEIPNIELESFSTQDLIAELLRRGDSRIRSKQLGLMTRLGITISGKPWVAQESGPFTVIVIRD